MIAMGYSERQRQEMEKTIHRTWGDLVLIATPFNLGLILNIDKPSRRVGYEVVCRNLPNTCSSSCARSAVLP
jgi:predicted GTPase